jgi:hypothetical protein
MNAFAAVRASPVQRSQFPELAASVQGRVWAVGKRRRFGLYGVDRVMAGERRLPEQMLKIADAALYRSKREGRNSVTADAHTNHRERLGDPDDAIRVPARRGHRR